MEDRGLPLLLAGLSALLFVCLVLNALNAVCRRGRHGARHGVLQGVGTLFLSVLLLRLSVAVWARGHGGIEGFDELGRLYGAGWFDLLADSFVHALQTFSLDEDYTLYLHAGRLFLGDGWAYGLYRLVADATAVAAPVLGGAIIFNLLCRIFPHARYALLEHSDKRYVFTQINERSLKLARSIRREEPESAIIFLKVDEQGNLRHQAETLRALCTQDVLGMWNCVSLPDRVAHALFPQRSVQLHLLLIDDDVQINLKMAARLAEGNQMAVHTLKKAEQCGFRVNITVFSNDEETAGLIDSANERLLHRANGEHASVMIAVQDDRNAILRLLKNCPPFLPLLSGAYDGLEICVIGGGSLAEEAVCQLYWYGQLLRPGTDEKMPFTLHVVAQTQEEEERLRQRLTHRMPEAFDETRPDCREAATFRFYAAHPDEGAFDALFAKEFGEVSSFLICPGTEDLVQRATLAVQRLASRREMERNRPTMVYCASQSATLGAWLEEHGDFVRKQSGVDCTVRAFGSMKERYSYAAVFRNELLHYAVAINDAYEKRSDGEPVDLTPLMRNSYRMNSSIAFAAHVSAKFYSAGLFDAQDAAGLTAARLADAARRFEEIKADARRFGEIARLEHLRWCAYVRSCGYRAVTVEEMARSQRGGDYRAKSVALRLHNCLVPMSGRPLFNRETDEPVRSRPEWTQEEPDAQWDELDTVSWRQHQLASRYYADRGVDPNGHPGVFEDYKTYDAKLLRRVSQNMIRYLADTSDENADLSARS